MRPAPRPAARVVLAGRFVVARASLVALPAGPVGGLDLTRGEPVSLAFGPAVGDDLLVSRIERWNGLAFAGCQPIRDLHRHRGRPLLAWSPPTALSPHEAPDDTATMLDDLATIGAALDDAGLGLPPGADAIVFVGVGGACLRIPAVWPPDATDPLARRLPADAARLLAGRPQPNGAPPVVPSGALRSRRTRVALIVAAGLSSAVVASIVVGGTHATPTARGAPIATVPAISVRVAPPVPVPARRTPQAPRLRPVARGGAARVLLAAPRPEQRKVAEVAPPVPRRRAARSGGWVEGLFVEQ